MTRYDPDRHHRRSIRLKGYDYTQPGAYFITICTYRRVCLFGQVIEGKMQWNGFGQIARDEWLRTAEIRPNVELDAFVVMPNHIHGIVIISDNRRGTTQNGRGTLQRAPTVERFGKPTSDSIPTIVRLFKSAVTKRINHQRGTRGMPVWQRNYYEHIIRTERALNAIRRYIVNNPARWHLDRYNADRIGPDPLAADAWRMVRNCPPVGARRRRAPTAPLPPNEEDTL